MGEWIRIGALLDGRLDASRVLRTGLTVLVPYVVSTLSSVQVLRGSAARNA